MLKMILCLLILLAVISYEANTTEIITKTESNKDSTTIQNKPDSEEIKLQKAIRFRDDLQTNNIDSLLEFRFKSPLFKHGQSIPAIYTCDSIDISPSIIVGLKQEGPKSFALICDDPDAPRGTWVHWVIFNLPARHLTLPQNINKVIRPDIGQDSTDIQPIQGINDFGKIGYGGPCPPIGPAHRYFFKLYALDTVLEFDKADIQKGVTKDMLLKAMEGHILAESVLMGKYKR